MPYCVAFGCSRKAEKGIFIFKFPKDFYRIKIWSEVALTRGFVLGLMMVVWKTAIKSFLCAVLNVYRATLTYFSAKFLKEFQNNFIKFIKLSTGLALHHIDKFSHLALGRRHTCCVCIRLPVSVTAPRYKRGITEDWSPHLNLANIL